MPKWRIVSRGTRTPCKILGNYRVGRMKRLLIVTLCLLGLVSSALADSARGSVTNLPLPRYVSIKAEKCNVRRGPSKSHRIDWVFQRKDMPVEITAEHGHWRRVRDRDGAGGWVHYALLSGVRTVIIETDMLDLHMGPDAATPVNARLESGVIARLGECTADMCKLFAGGYRGWAPKSALWGVKPDEIRD